MVMTMNMNHSSSGKTLLIMNLLVHTLLFDIRYSDMEMDKTTLNYTHTHTDNMPYLQALVFLPCLPRANTSSAFDLQFSSSSSNFLECKHSGGRVPPGARSLQHEQHLRWTPFQSCPYHQWQECAWCGYLQNISDSRSG